jgi:type IV secretory pathway VirB2 component (pilin)
MPVTHSIAIVLVTAAAIFGSILLHYEALSVLTRVLASLHTRVRRRRILLMMFGLLALHVAEIWIFGIGYYLMATQPDLSSIAGANNTLLDLVYFSAVVYTTLGLGDLVPTGAIRFMAGSEALTGFLLISWSASFTFLEMQKFWDRRVA